MNMKLVFAIVTIAFSASTAVAPSGIYASNGESLAPGQGIDPFTGEPVHNNPSEGNPPPGQNDPDQSNIFGNVGQCQQYLRDHFPIDRHDMQEFCHEF